MSAETQFSGASPSSQRPAQPAVLWLGASNFALCLPRVWSRLSDRPERELVAVCGHGRAFCGPSLLGGRWLGRELPAVTDGLRELREIGAPTGCRRDLDLGAVPALTVLGDLGNDLAYGRTADTVLEAVCRLIDGHRWPNTVLVEPPCASVARLSPTAFRWAARLLFPGRPIERRRLLRELELLRDGLQTEAAGRRGVEVVPVPTSWYGFDAIHVARRARGAFVGSLLSRCPDGEASEATPGRLRGRLPPWWRRRPASEAAWLLGRRRLRFTPQPVRGARQRLWLG